MFKFSSKLRIRIRDFEIVITEMEPVQDGKTGTVAVWLARLALLDLGVSCTRPICKSTGLRCWRHVLTKCGADLLITEPVVAAFSVSCCPCCRALAMY